MMMRLGLVTVALTLVVFFVIYRIIKLPSRYDRKPQTLSPWSALDHGIDPSTVNGEES
ncbi:MAG: hypothetical protein AABY37_07495 [Actinomycetota bacterium]